MSHHEKLDAIVRDLIEPAASVAMSYFDALPLNAHFAAASGALDTEAC